MTHWKSDLPEPARRWVPRALEEDAEQDTVGFALQRAFDLLVPALADYAFLHVLTDEGWTARNVRHRDARLEPALIRLLADARARMTAPGSPIGRAYESNEPQLSDVGPGPGETGTGPGPAAFLGPRSYLAVPVFVSGERFGVLTMARFETEQPYGPRDLAPARRLAKQLGLTLELAGSAAAWQNAAAEARARITAEAEERAAADEARARAMKALSEAEAARQEALEQLAATDERKQTAGQRFEARLLDAVGEAVIATDLDGGIVYWNREAERLYGWSRGEALGRDLGETAPAVASREQASAAMAQMMAGKTWSGRLEVRRKDGTTFPASVTGTPIFGDDGEPVGLICISADVSGRTVLEERLRRAQRAQAVGRVAGGVAHEINNCLTSISGYAELIRREMESDDPLLQDLEAVEEASRRAAGLIQQLLAYSRRQVLQPRDVSLNGIVEGMSAVLGSLLGDEVEFSTDLQASPDVVHVDQGQLEQVITHLVLNAQEAVSDSGRVTIRTANVELTSQDARQYAYPVESGRYVRLLVEDDGSGMDAATLERSFEPFFTTKNDGPAAGLGLSTAYGVVKQSGGYLWVDSSPGAGTTVRILLPRVPDVEGHDSSTDEPQPQRSVVLIVEDDRPVRELAIRVLQQEGYDVLEAADGMAALALWESHRDRVDLVVTDVVMPQMSGRALIDRLRTQRPELPALFMSGYTDDTAALQGIADGRDPFLGKPFSGEALSAKVRELVSGTAV